MKNSKFAILFGLVLMLCCFSCKKAEETIVSVDFGEGKYKEPFRGLLSSHPQWLVSTLDWPVLRSLRPDTLVLTKTIEIGFNEDAVRSHSTATIQFVDDSCNRLDGVKVYCNGKFVDSDDYIVEASSEPQLINIAYKIDPLKKECTETGHFIISGVELDEVNNVKLFSDSPHDVADWTFTQKIGWPILLWLVWLLMIILPFLLIVLLCKAVEEYGFFKGHPFLPRESKCLKQTRNHSSIWQSFFGKKEFKQCKREVQRSEEMFQNTDIPCSDKEEELEKLYSYLERIKKENPNLYGELYNSLNPDTKKALNKLDEIMWRPTPREGRRGHWEGTSNGNKFVLSESDPSYEACKEVGMTDCEYGHTGGPNFDRATEKGTVVSCEDLYDKYDSKQLDRRGGGNSFNGSFQDRAQERIAIKKQSEILEYWKRNHPNDTFYLYNAYYEWRNSKNLVPHEDANCRTLRLVYAPVHKAFGHSGGIARIRIIKDCFG